MNQSDLMQPIAAKVNQLLEKYEYLISLLSLLAIILNYYHISPADILMQIVLSAYAAAIFLCAYLPVLPDEEGQVKNPQMVGFTNFIFKLTCLSSSVALLSILFNFSKWPGGEVMGNLSIINCGVCLLGMLILQFGYHIKSKAFDPRNYYRLAILLVFSLYFMIERNQLFG
jgi:hypothetical protein